MRTGRLSLMTVGAVVTGPASEVAGPGGAERNVARLQRRVSGTGRAFSAMCPRLLSRLRRARGDRRPHSELLPAAPVGRASRLARNRLLPRHAWPRARRASSGYVSPPMLPQRPSCAPSSRPSPKSRTRTSFTDTSRGWADPLERRTREAHFAARTDAALDFAFFFGAFRGASIVPRQVAAPHRHA